MNIIRKKLVRFTTDLSRFIQYGDLPTWYYVKRGMKVGQRFDRQSGTRLDISNCWLIEIGDDVVMANRVQILAHDNSAEHATGYQKVGRVIIGNNVFIGAGALILPGVTIGDNCVIGAQAVVTKDIPANSLAVGAPAKVVGTMDAFLEKNQKEIELAKEEGRILDIEYDIHCKSKKKVDGSQLEPGKKYFFKIKHFSNE